MRHFHGLTTDKILRLSPAQLLDGVGCFKVAETPLGDRKLYRCRPGWDTAEPRPKKPPTTRASERCSCGRIKKHCQRKSRGAMCSCGQFNCI